MTPDGLGLSQLAAELHPLLVLLPRFGAALLVLPLLKKTFVSRQIRIAFVMALAMVAFPHAAATVSVTDWTPAQWAVFTVKEIFIGSLIGYAMGILLWAVGAVGDLMDLQTGFQNAQIFNPFGTQPGGPFAALMTQLVVLLFVGYGGLQVFLQLLFESLLLWPPASFTPSLTSAGQAYGVALSGSVLEVATRLAAPVIGALLIVELGIGLVNRTAPQLNTFYFSMPIKAVTALLILALMLSHLVDIVREDIGQADRLLDRLDHVWRPR